jgi:hypothetical protein
MGFTKWNQKKNYETKQNFTFDETKRNETKFRCFLCFAKQAKFHETIFLFRFVSCFAKQKKGCEMETLGRPPIWVPFLTPHLALWGFKNLGTGLRFTSVNEKIVGMMCMMCWLSIALHESNTNPENSFSTP